MTRKKPKKVKGRDEPNLRRFRYVIQDYISESTGQKLPKPAATSAATASGSESDDDDFGKIRNEVNQEPEERTAVHHAPRPIPRKQRRKEERKLKKAKRLAFSQHRKVSHP